MQEEKGAVGYDLTEEAVPVIGKDDEEDDDNSDIDDVIDYHDDDDRSSVDSITPGDDESSSSPSVTSSTSDHHAKSLPYNGEIVLLHVRDHSEVICCIPLPFAATYAVHLDMYLNKVVVSNPHGQLALIMSIHGKADSHTLMYSPTAQETATAK